jgi:hypothetical protein
VVDHAEKIYPADFSEWAVEDRLRRIGLAITSRLPAFYLQTQFSTCRLYARVDHFHIGDAYLMGLMGLQTATDGYSTCRNRR